MKKIIFFAFLVCGGYLFGQDTVKIEGYSTTTTTTNSHYVTVYTETPAKAARKFYAENAFPFIYSGGIVSPRSISTNLVIGGTTNPYGDKLYVNGTETVSGNFFGMGRIYVGTGRSSYLYAIGNQLYFYSPTTGSKSLAQLGSGGGIDLTLVPNKSVIVERADTAYGTLKFTFNDTTLNVQSVALKTLAIGSGAGKSLASTATYNTLIGYQSGYSLASGTFNTILGSEPWTGSANNEHNTMLGAKVGASAQGDSNIYMGSNTAKYTIGGNNIIIGNYLGIDNYPYPTYIHDQLFIEAHSTEFVPKTRFTSLIWGDFKNDSLRLNADVIVKNTLIAKDSVYLELFEGSEDPWLTVTPTGAIDTGNTEPAWIGWEMELPSLKDYEKDKKMVDGHWERKVWYIDNKTKELKSQYGWDGLGMMETQSAYAIYHEITMRYMVEQGKEPLWRVIASILIFLLFMLLLIKQHIRLVKIEQERINNRR